MINLISSMGRSIALTALVSLIIGISYAQDDETTIEDDDSQPISIIPLEELENEPIETVVPEPEPTLQEDEQEQTTLEIVSLPEVNEQGAGLLVAGTGGFAADIWEGSDGRVVATLLPQITGDSGSAVLTSLARRLLLSTTVPPVSDSDDFLEMRIERLVALGMHTEAAQLVSRISKKVRTTTIRNALVDAHFLSGANEQACDRIHELLLEEDNAELSRALIFCQRLAGENAAAELSLTILRETGVEPGDKFLELDRSLVSGEPVTVSSLDNLDPLLFAMTLAVGGEIAEISVSNVPAAVLRAFAMREQIPLDLRLSAAESAVARGLMDPSILRDLYIDAAGTENVSFDLVLSDLRGPMSRAQLYQLASKQILVADRLRTISLMLQFTREERDRSGYLAAARASAPEVSRIRPSPDTAWLAGDAVRVLLGAGAVDAAMRWWPIIESHTESAQLTENELDRLWILLRLGSGTTLELNAERVDRWVSGLQSAESDETSDDTAQMFALLDALDDEIAEKLLPKVLLHTAEPAAANLRSEHLLALVNATENGRTGEVILLSLILLGNGELNDADPVSLYFVVRSLMQSGFENEARMLAVETKLADGL